jgi:hypothetical protein
VREDAPEPERAPDEDLREEPPPIGGSWPVLYAAVAGNLVFWIVLFWVFTWAFR